LGKPYKRKKFRVCKYNGIVGISEPLSAQQLAVYTNPVCDILHLDLNPEMALASDAYIEVLDAKGTIIFQEKDVSAIKNIAIDTQKWAQGEYFLVLVSKM
jgi:Secretion system C-terminal sorting domain